MLDHLILKDLHNFYQGYIYSVFSEFNISSPFMFSLCFAQSRYFIPSQIRDIIFNVWTSALNILGIYIVSFQNFIYS